MAGSINKYVTGVTLVHDENHLRWDQVKLILQLQNRTMPFVLAIDSRGQKQIDYGQIEKVFY